MEAKEEGEVKGLLEGGISWLPTEQQTEQEDIRCHLIEIAEKIIETNRSLSRAYHRVRSVVANIAEDMNCSKLKH
jgi:hypothetical protein